MDLEALSRNDWIRAATLAQMLLSQTLPDERVDELVRSQLQPPVEVPHAA
ncbi:MAG: hypothetical protein QOJ23_4684 [Actinomycetota bacterium]|jgi:hypothetical protein|nr:hypothetical protein [Actinomycetota bacterium]